MAPFAIPMRLAALTEPGNNWQLETQVRRRMPRRRGRRTELLPKPCAAPRNASPSWAERASVAAHQADRSRIAVHRGRHRAP